MRSFGLEGARDYQSGRQGAHICGCEGTSNQGLRQRQKTQSSNTHLLHQMETAYANGSLEDTLAALDNVGPLPSYRTPVSHLTLPQSKRYSGQFYGDRSTSLLSGNAFRPGSPTENDYRSSQQRAPRIISPPLENARSNLYSPPTGGSGASRTPRTPREWKLSGPPSGSPNNTRSQRMNPGTSYEDIMKLENVRNVRIPA